MLYFSIKKACVSLIFLCNLQYKPERTDIYHYVASFLSSSYPYDLYISISTNKKMIRPSETIENTLICCYSSSSSKTKNCFNTRLWFFVSVSCSTFSKFYVCVSTLFICLLFSLFGLLWNKFLMVLRDIINCSKCYTTLSKKNPKIKNINLNINVVVVRYIYIFFVYGFSSLKIKISKKKSTKKKMTKWKEQPK